MLNLKQFKAKLSQSGEVNDAVFSGADRTLEFLWCFEMRAKTEDIWPYISDTSRLNREMGFTRRQQEEQPDGRVFVSTTLAGLPQRWVEEPWTWVAGKTISSTRTYTRGIAKKMVSVFYLETDPETQKQMIYIYFSWKPSHFFAGLFLKATAPLLENKFKGVFDKIDKHLLSQSPQTIALQKTPEALSPQALDKIHEIKSELLTKNVDSETANRLIDFVSTGDDFELEPIRVVPLARFWNLDEKNLLVTCLHATRLGLLKISWDTICPHCRGSRYSAESLGDIPDKSSCGVCETEFETDSENSIEVTFHVHPGIRKVEAQLFCSAEPSKKKHIKVQQLVSPGQKLDLKISLPDGIYRARHQGHPGSTQIQVHSKFTNDVAIIESSHQPIQVTSSFGLNWQNSGTEPSLFVLEEMWWENSMLKPAQVFSLNEFRDLFAEEHLSSSVKLYLGEQTILFTDIVGSTKFYEAVGDAKAFADVRSHFQEVFKEVKSHNGVIVKTIGDAVMAAFPKTQEAIESAIQIQKCFYSHRTDTPIRLRISLHTGVVIAVHFNSGIDYFGSTVNLAAKIQACAGSGEIALSKKAYQVLCRESDPNLPFELRSNAIFEGTSVDVFVLKAHDAIKAA